MAKMTTITCPTDCSVANLPTINFQDCNPAVHSSEIVQLFVGRPDAIAFTDVTAAAGWNDRISSNNTPPGGSSVAAKDLLRKLIVIGDIPAPNATTRAISGGRTITTKNTYTLNFEIDDVSDENWQFGQTVQCGKGSFPCKIWPVTKSGHVLGGDAGISGKMKIDHILDRGEDGIMRLVGTVTFETIKFPNRDVFPLAV